MINDSKELDDYYTVSQEESQKIENNDKEQNEIVMGKPRQSQRIKRETEIKGASALRKLDASCDIVVGSMRSMIRSTKCRVIERTNEVQVLMSCPENGS